MTTPDITAVRSGVAANAVTAEGLEDAKSFRPDASYAGIAFWTTLKSVSPSAMGRGHWLLELEGQLRVYGTQDHARSESIDEMVLSVWQAIESDRTCGGAAMDIEVTGAETFSVFGGEDGTPYGINYEITVEI